MFSGSRREHQRSSDLCFRLIFEEWRVKFDLMKPEESEIVPARVIGSSNEPLVDGRARFIGSQSRGVFWPNGGANDELLKQGVAVQISFGETIPVFKIQRCPAEWPTGVHYDFEWTP